MFTIRKVQQGDALTLAVIQTQSWKAAFCDILTPDTLHRSVQPEKASAMYQRLLDDHIGNGYILQVDERPHCIAWWDASREKDMPGYAELICIHSLPDNWHKGYGSAMMEQILNDVSAAGYRKIMLWVFEENHRAIEFYKAHGFLANGRRQEAMGAWEVMYEREIE